MPGIIPNNITTMALTATWTRAPGLALTAHVSRSSVVGNQGAVFWVEGDTTELRKIGIDGLDVTWTVDDTPSLTVFPELEAVIGATRYARALDAIGGLVTGTYRGPVAGHCFSGAAGDYTVTCTIRDRSGIVQTILAGTVTKIDPDVYYSGANTICYSTSGTFTGAPSGSTQVTVAAGGVTRTDSTQNSNKRILLRTGETFTGGIGTRGISNTYIGTFGGTTPANWTSQFWLRESSGVPCTNVTFDNLSLDFGYDPTAANDWWNEGVAPTQPSTAFFDVTASGVSGYTFHKVRANGVNMGFYVLGTRHVFFDCGVSRYFDFGIFDNKDECAFIGCFSAQDPLAPNVQMSAGGNTVPSNRNSWNTIVLGNVATAQAAHAYFGPNGECPNWPRHGPFRNVPVSRFGVVKSAFYNSNPGWSGDPQPAMRYMRDSVGIETAYGSISQSYFCGGANVLNVNDNIATTAPRLIVIDGVTIEADRQLWGMVNLNMGNTYIRNTMFLLPETETVATIQSYADIIGATSRTGAGGTGAIVENCSIVLRANMGTKTTDCSKQIGGVDITYRNNLLINTTINSGGITVPSGTVTETSVAGFDADYAPRVTTTTVVGQATNPAAVRDRAGALRPASASVGASEVP